MAAPGLSYSDYDMVVAEAAARNWIRRRQEREQNKLKAAAGQIREVESAERLAAYNRYQQDAEQARREAYAEVGTRASLVLNTFAQERVIGVRDFMGIEFLEMAMAVGRFVGRIHIRERAGETAGFGTGFIVSPRLLLTNHHVLPAEAIARHSEVEFDYQKDRFGRPLPVVVCGLEPDTFFLSDPRLDFTLVAVSEQSVKGVPLSRYAWVKLHAASGKALIDDPLNIIQHPRGEMKQLVLRSNKLVDVFDDFLHYETDTEPGSSGSPVFSDAWDVVALHHSGVPKMDGDGNFIDIDGNVWVDGRDDPDRLAWVGNEGIRVSSLVKFIEEADLDKQTKEQLRRDLLEKEPPHPIELLKSSGPRTLPDLAGATVSVTVPLHLTVGLGTPVVPDGDGAPVLTNSDRPQTMGPGAQAGGTSTGRVRDTRTDREILAAAKQELGKRADVLDVELGYVFDETGWITDERAVVVTRRPAVRLKAKEVAEEMPNEFRGCPVEVIDPSIEDMVRTVRGPQVAEAAFAEELQPEEIQYEPPRGVSLKKVTETMRVVAHLGPDAGWPHLKKFLGKTKERLVIGMYDFGAPHIVDALKKLADKDDFRQLTLVLQKGQSVGEGTKANDLRDDEVVEKLEHALGEKFDQAWVKIGSVNGWVAYSYHIKVAVRDRRAFWLSSGNWQSSNQPKADPLNDDPDDPSWLFRYNREWHAIVEHADLAKIFEKHLLNDYENNEEADAYEALALPDLLIPDAFFVPTAEEEAAQLRYFPAFNENRAFTVLPLLTPDNYHEEVLKLIRSAEDELLIQNQTFNVPKPSHDHLEEILDAILDRQRAGVKVWVIFRLFDRKKARQTLSGLKDLGFDVGGRVKVQKNCHTKGIVVDGRRVLLGSHNLSNAGVSVNRDASLLFDDQPLAEYFAKVFWHDWHGLARRSIGTRTRPMEWVPAAKATPEGMVRLGWKDYMEMW